MSMQLLALYLVVGAASGFTAGLFGVGGGLVIVPALIALFAMQGFSAVYTTHLAIGTSLAIIMLTSISSVLAHHRQGAVRWLLVKHMAGGLFIGAFIGAGIADMLPSRILQAIIGVFAVWVAYSMYSKTLLAPTKTHAAADASAKTSDFSFALFSVSGVIGVASAIFGIGGGSLTVPYLSHRGVAMVNAVATAAACGFPIAIAGALGFMFFGKQTANLPPYALGYVYVPAFVGMSVSSVFTAQLGAKLAHYLPAKTLKRLFAMLLLTIGLLFIYKASMGVGRL